MQPRYNPPVCVARSCLTRKPHCGHTGVCFKTSLLIDTFCAKQVTTYICSSYENVSSWFILARYGLYSWRFFACFNNLVKAATPLSRFIAGLPLSLAVFASESPSSQNCMQVWSGAFVNCVSHFHRDFKWQLQYILMHHVPFSFLVNHTADWRSWMQNQNTQLPVKRPPRDKWWQVTPMPMKPRLMVQPTILMSQSWLSFASIHSIRKVTYCNGAKGFHCNTYS